MMNNCTKERCPFQGVVECSLEECPYRTESQKYINADELMEIIKTHHYMLANAINSRDYGMFTTGIEQAISETESIEIVRCKDCKYNYLDPNDKKKCLKVDRISNPDFYCADGERKETE